MPSVTEIAPPDPPASGGPREAGRWVRKVVGSPDEALTEPQPIVHTLMGCDAAPPLLTVLSALPGPRSMP